MMSRTLSVRVKAAAAPGPGPIERHRTKVREFIKEIQVRRAKSETKNQEFINKNQMILKQIFQDEVTYFKSFWDSPSDSGSGSSNTKENVVNYDVVEPTIISDSYDEDVKA